MRVGLLIREGSGIYPRGGARLGALSWEGEPGGGGCLLPALCWLVALHGVWEQHFCPVQQGVGAVTEAGSELRAGVRLEGGWLLSGAELRVTCQAVHMLAQGAVGSCARAQGGFRL